METHWYRPMLYVDGPGDHTYVAYPPEYHLDLKFASIKDANAWMREHGYKRGEYTVKKFCLIKDL